MEKLIEIARNEWEVLRAAPGAVVMLAVALGGVIWLALDWRYRGIIEQKEATIQQKEATIRHFQMAVTDAKPKVTKPNNLKDSNSYVFAVRGNVYHLKNGSPTQGYAAFINNDSNKFAQVLSWKVGITVASAPPPDKLEDFGSMTAQEGKPILRPRAIYWLYRNYKVLDKQQIRKILLGKMKIYVFGIITYATADDVKYRVEFCHMYYGTEQAGKFDGYLASQGKFCPNHNKVTKL